MKSGLKVYCLLAVAFLTASMVCADTITNSFIDTKANAEKGDADAQCILGLMYATGQGVRKDEAEAVRWFH